MRQTCGICQWRESANNDVRRERFENRRDQANSTRDDATRLMINGKRECDLSQGTIPIQSPRASIVSIVSYQMLFITL